jgi:hypothetical protein
MDCMVCLEPLEPGVQHNTGVHPLCDSYGPEVEAVNRHLKQSLTEIIQWANENSPRSLQAEIGPSELGTPCDRKMAYKRANNREINKRRDPWPAIVGTGIHRWLEEAVNQFQGHYGLTTYLTEQELVIDPLVLGHTDLYEEGTVIDYKSCGPDVLKKIVKHGPPAGYRIQTQLYGKGHADAGRSVRYVALVFLPRAGFLSGMYVWSDVYRPEIAERALARMYSIGRGLIAADVANNPDIYERIPAASDHCGWCPYYLREGSLAGASADGCPGAE